jgi:hypothetical protein
VRRFDVGVIDFGAGGRRWFINVAGIGFDAGVVENMPSRSLGRLAYLIGLMRELAAYRPLPFLRWKGILRSVAFEREPIPDLDLSAVDEKKVRWFLKRAREARGYPLAADTPVSEALAHLDLLSDDQLTQSAVLLFGKKPQSWLPASEVTNAHFSEPKTSSGIASN